jgi:hypothetical protein
VVGDEAGEDVVAAMAEGAEGGDNRGSSIHSENRALHEPNLDSLVISDAIRRETTATRAEGRRSGECVRGVAS